MPVKKSDKPSPEKESTYFELLRKLNSGTKDPAERVDLVYHFAGEEDFLKDEAWRKIASLLVPDELKSFNLDLMYGNETGADQLVNKVFLSPVNARKRLVVVFDLNRLSEFSKDMLLKILPKLPDSVCLILVSPDIPSKSKFYPALTKLVTTVKFPRLWDNQVPVWITNRVKEKGKKIEGGASRILHDLVGNEMGDLSTSIDKLITYIGDNETITAKDVEAAVDLSKTNTVFHLIDSIGEQNCKTSLEILENMILDGEKPGGMIYWLTIHFERLIQTKEFLATSSGPLTSFLRVKPFLANKYQKQAPNFTMEELEEGIMLLYQTDVELKSNRMPDKMIMELLVYNLCHL
ncbi:MAG TPA: DNA polymerase III subunit delta [candidate division Zixibacteria bacterium]